MNKRILGKYFYKTSGRPALTHSCYVYNDNYLISDTYSVIKLKENYCIPVREEDKEYIKNMNKQLINIYEDFDNNYVFYKEHILDKTQQHNDIDENYSMFVEDVNRIKNIIKADKITIMKNDSKSAKYIIKIENTKTNEIGFQLPCRKY